MFKRSFFWLGLLLGGLVALGTRRFWLPTRPSLQNSPSLRDPLLDLVGDAVALCDASGAVLDLNTAAQTLFGPDGAGLFRLCYPSGQPVPPGQLPVSRVLRTGKAIEGTGYVCVSAQGKTHSLDIQARPLMDGRVAVTARDTTALMEGKTRETTLGKREQVLRALCRRLSAARDAGELAQSLVESALALMDGRPETQVRLYSYDSEAKQLTRLASAPPDRPKRPKSQRQAQLPTFPFDASSPLLWSVYIAREPAVGTDVGDDTADSAYALPLLAGGVALGHLLVVCPAADAFTDLELRETLGLITSVAALALAGPRQAAQTTALAGQVEALRAVIGAIGERSELGALADLVSRQVCHVTGAEVCTLALMGEDGLHLIGKAYRDALLFPDRHALDDAALIGDAARAAVKKGKTTQRTGLANPPFEAGIWRAFAGQSGRHSVISVPLEAGQGALNVSIPGDTSLPDAQVKFLETLAALVSATLPEASRPAERTIS